MIVKNICNLQRKIGYSFQEINLLKRALTHCSADIQHNEKLEFLGDSILSFLITDDLYHRFPEINEGLMSQIRSVLIRSKTLARIAKEIKLGKYLYLGFGEFRNQGFKKKSILANAFEALIGSIFLDSNIFVTQRVVLSLYKTRLDQINPNQEQKDFKTLLQEYLQGRHLSLPNYSIYKNSTDDICEQGFIVYCVVDCLKDPVIGIGSSKRKAEQKAARNVLKVLKII